VRHKSVNTPLSHERHVGGLQDGGRGTHVTHFVQLYPQPLYTASQVRTTCRSWDEGVLTDVCLTLYIEIKCVKLVINKNYTEMHGQRNIKLCETFFFRPPPPQTRADRLKIKTYALVRAPGPLPDCRAPVICTGTLPPTRQILICYCFSPSHLNS